MAVTFEELGLSEPTLKAISELGYEEPTSIQARTIRRMLEGADVIAQAQTGTGKTAAFALPIIERLDPAQRAPQALVMTPTRELAVQVAEAFHAYGKYHRVAILPVYGGQPIERQLRALDRGVQVVVGTPGRLLDHIGRGYGILRHAYSMNSKEALNLLSFMKLGIDLSFFPEDCRQPVDELFMETQPAHLQKGTQQKLAADERDSLRAEIILAKLAAFPQPDVGATDTNPPPEGGNGSQN